MKNSAHFVLQGKGGVGKSLVSSMLAQYLQVKGYTPFCGDTDPVNTTFHQIESLDVKLIPITEGGTVIQRLFDPLFEKVLEEENPIVIDNGASTFLPMIKFMVSNDILETMDNFNKEVYIHTIVTGGQAKDDTANGLLALIDMIKSSNSKAKIIVWQNDFWGEPKFNGKSLDDVKWMKNNKDIISGIVKIIDRNSDAYTTDLRLMSEKHMTFTDVKNSDEFGLLAKSRIHKVFKDVFDEIDTIFEVESHGQ